MVQEHTPNPSQEGNVYDAESLGYILLIALSNTEKEYGMDNSLSNTLLLLINMLRQAQQP